MGKGVSGVRVGGARGRFSRRQVIGVAGADALPVPVRALAHQPVGPELAYRPAHVPSQVQGRGQTTVGVTEKGDVGHPELGAGGPLLLAADAGHVRTGDRPVRAAGVAVGGDAVGDLDAGFDPGRHRSPGPEVHVVGMGGHDQDALDGAGLVKGKNRFAIGVSYLTTLSNGPVSTLTAPARAKQRHAAPPVSLTHDDPVLALLAAQERDRQVAGQLLRLAGARAQQRWPGPGDR